MKSLRDRATVIDGYDDDGSDKLAGRPPGNAGVILEFCRF